MFSPELIMIADQDRLFETVLNPTGQALPLPLRFEGKDFNDLYIEQSFELNNSRTYVDNPACQNKTVRAIDFFKSPKV